MRTALLLGIAAATLLLAEKGHSATVDTPSARDATAITEWAPQRDFTARGHDKHPPLDYGADYRGDERVYTGAPDRDPTESDYRHTVDTDYEGRWTGTWNGTYEAPDGGEYRGTYEGTYEGAGAPYPPPAYHDRYIREDAEMARRCRRDDGIGGAVIGGVVGGAAGRAIAGRGDRTAGTLIGAGVGALAGAAIDKAEDKKRCDAWRARQHHDGYPGGGYPHGGYYTHGGYGYGYYSPGVVVTTIVTPQQYVTEEITTTTVTYENVAVAKKRHAPKRHYKPKPKPRCTCR